MKKNLSIRMTSLFFVLALSFTACGGGGDNGSAITSNTTFAKRSQSPAGLWQGTTHSSVTNNTYSLVGIISENHTTRFISSANGQYKGVISVNGDAVTSTMTGFAPLGYVFPDGTQVSTLNVSGTLQEKSKIDAVYTGAGDIGSITLSYDPVYDRASNLSLTAGTWKSSSSGIVYTVAIDNAGTITGNTSSGCVFSGNVSIIDSAYNCYDVTLTVSSCGILNGSYYNGLATIGDSISTNDTLITGLSNLTASITLSLARQ